MNRAIKIFLILLLGVALGYAWKTYHMIQWEQDIAAHIRKLEMHRTYLIARLADAESRLVVKRGKR